MHFLKKLEESFKLDKYLIKKMSNEVEMSSQVKLPQRSFPRIVFSICNKNVRPEKNN